MSDDEYLSVVLASVAVALAVWVCWPHLLVALGLSRFQNGIQGGPGSLDPGDKEEDYQDKYFQLVDLGFLPLGIHWARNGSALATATYVFGSPNQPMMAALSLRSHTLSLLTAFADNLFLQTLDRETRLWQSSSYRLQGLADVPLREVIATHQKAIETLAAQGHQPQPAATLEDFARIARAMNDQPASRRWVRTRALRSVATLLAGFLLCGALSGYAFGFNQPSTWMGLIAFSLWLKWQWQASVQGQLPDEESKDE
jgi:hypothetical protein